MTRGAGHYLNHRTLMTAAVAAAVVLGLAPAGWIGWVTWLRRPVETVLAPIQNPVRTALNFVRGRVHGEELTSPELDALREERDDFRARFLNEREVNDRLREQIVELQRGAALRPDLPVKQVMAPVIGPATDLTSGLLKVKAGRRDGVEVWSVAVTRAVHLVGRVTEAADRFCYVLPITDRDAGLIQGVVMLDETTVGPMCQLEPLGTGDLRGKVGEEEGKLGESDLVEAGMEVLLRDPTWPEHAQMLTIGTVVEVKASEEHPLRKIVTVRPRYPVDRVSEMGIRSLGEDEGGGR